MSYARCRELLVFHLRFISSFIIVVESASQLTFQSITDNRFNAQFNRKSLILIMFSDIFLFILLLLSEQTLVLHCAVYIDNMNLSNVDHLSIEDSKINCCIPVVLYVNVTRLNNVYKK